MFVAIQRNIKKSSQRIGFGFGILVGGFNPSEKYEFVKWDDYMIIPNIWENNLFMFQSPPTSIIYL